eukprot:PhF_6_TR23946/c0_g1_i1/m.33508
MSTVLSIVMFLALLSTSRASIGDDSLSFKRCLDECKNQLPFTPNWIEIITFWTHTESCEYTCMRKDVALRESQNQPAVQYYGSWGFRRVLGLEEFGSVVFSLIHCYIHTVHGKRTWSVFPQGPRRIAWRLFVVLWAHGWFWSAMYHARHKHLFMIFDYMGAQAALMGSLYFAAIYTLPILTRTTVSFMVFTGLAAGAYVYHAIRMLFVKFDYGVNMNVGIAIGVTHHLLYAQSGVRSFFGRGGMSPPQKTMLVAVFIITSAALFEIYDFPPILFETTDAHAMWHFATIPAALLWYKFATYHLKQDKWCHV